MHRWDRLWTNVNLATMEEGGDPYGAIRDGAIAVASDRIVWVGAMADLPQHQATETVDGGRRWLTPGLIDCHTHIVHGGNRVREFEMRLNGATYEEIARAGGGIVSTVAATRIASEDELVASGRRRIEALLAEGVTTIEIKSGYGLDTETELKMLRAARRLGRELPVDVRTTFLGAHTVPREFADDRIAYLDLVCDDMLPRASAEGLVDAVDAFCETIAFTPDETARVFEAAARLGLPVKLHADQLNDTGGAALAARFNALSADHLEHVSEAGVAAMAGAGVTAVLLPGAFYFLRDTHKPPVELLRRYRVPMALATDSNPGTSPTRSLLLMLNMACTLFRLTPEEALAGVTRNGARALGLDKDRGTLAAGKRADFVLWDIGEPAELCYTIGGRPDALVVRGGSSRDGA